MSKKHSMPLAYGIKRHMKKAPKKMANGGQVPPMSDEQKQEHKKQMLKNLIQGGKEAFAPVKKAHGGMVDMKKGSLVDAIMQKRMGKKQMHNDDDGAVDLSLNAKARQPHEYEEQNMEAGMKELYDDELDDFPQPVDSNELDVDLEDSDLYDMVSAIRRKIRARQR